MVIYDGTSEIVQGVLGEDVDVLATAYSSALPFIESEELEMFLVAIADEKPPEETPDAETLGSVGISQDVGQQIQNSLIGNRTFAGPPGIPEERTAILREAFEEAIHDEDFRDDAAEAERPVDYADAETAAQIAQDQVEIWTENRDLIEN